MAAVFYLEIVTPERKFFSGEVEAVILRTPDGEMGVLKDHAPMVVAVDIGPIKIKKDGEWLEAALSEGFMEIEKNTVIILTDTAEWPDEIDIARAKAAAERAEERLRKGTSRIEYIHSKSAMARAVARLKVAKQIK